MLHGLVLDLQLLTTKQQDVEPLPKLVGLQIEVQRFAKARINFRFTLNFNTYKINKSIRKEELAALTYSSSQNALGIKEAA